MAETRFFQGSSEIRALRARAGDGACGVTGAARAASTAGVFAAALSALLAAAPSAAAQTPPDDQGGAEAPASPTSPAPLSDAPEGTWGVGGKEEEGKFAPQGKTGSLKREVDEPDTGKPVDLGPPGELSVDAAIGFGAIRDVQNDARPTDTTAISIVGGIAYRFFDIWTISLRLPFTSASITGPRTGGEDDYNATVLGNLELTVRPSFKLTRRLRLPVWISLYAPTAAGDPFAPIEDNVGRAEALVNQSAMATRGWEENALFAPSRIGVAPGAGLTYDRGALHAALETKLELMFRSGGGDPYAQTGEPLPELRSLATDWVTSGEVLYDFLDGKVSPGLRTWLAVNTVPIAAGTRDYSGAQLVFEPEVSGRFPLNAAGTIAIRAGAGVLIPAGGHLGGANDATVNAVRVKASLLF